MELAAFLEEISALPGQSGMESPVARRIAAEFSRYSDRVSLDKLGNVRAEMGQGSPTVMVAAHMDEVGLIVTGIEDNGFLRFWQMGGIDPRILPGSEVTVHGRKPLFGVIGVKPPHLTDGAHKAARLDELTIDVGFTASQVRELVQVGDPISFKAPLTRLMNERIALKTLDDRACVACMAVAMELLSRARLNCRVVFCATVQEEVGSRGAQVAAYDLKPDLAVAFDVSHGTTPGADPWETMPLDKVGLGMGPTIHPKMLARLRETAEQLNVDVQVEVSAGKTYTDADNILLTRAGVPTALMDLPLTYMHTMVETVSLRTTYEAGRLLAGFLMGVDGRWEEWLCL